MDRRVLSFQDIRSTDLIIVGGKAANLARLSRIDGIQVPAGFCVTTKAYRTIISRDPELPGLLDELRWIEPTQRENIGRVSAKIRQTIETIPIPADMAEEIADHLARLGESHAFAIRSSATTEDLPTASFAGQYDSYLNIAGRDAVLTHISKCWASLYRDQAVIYRMQNGFDHREISIGVIVQQMIFATASGVLFTADALSSNRKMLSIDAVPGIGESLVSGRVNPDNYKVIDGTIAAKTIAAKKPDEQNIEVLTDKQILRLERLGREIESHFACPQDIEWCLAGDDIYIVQSRPVTTLYPVPGEKDEENHVYVSVGHQQMMTDAMKPLGISLFQATAARPMPEAGGRLFVDITQELASPVRRHILVDVLGRSDPLIKDALMTIIGRDGFLKTEPGEGSRPGADGKKAVPLPDFQTLAEYDPAIVPRLMENSRQALAGLKQDIQAKSGVELMDFILEDIQKLKKSLSDPQSFGVIMTGMNAFSWINDKMLEWLGEKNVADTLSQSLPDNITSEMGLELMDVADLIRPFPELIKYLQQVKDENFLDQLTEYIGGKEARNAIDGYLDKYGMRCAGEIDITKPRWCEKPATLIPMILNNIKNLEPHAGSRRFEQGRRQALSRELEIVGRLKQLPDGEQKARETKRMIGLVRSLCGYREYPKYGMVCRYFVYKQALLREAGRLVEAGVLNDKEDIYFLRLEEFRELLLTGQSDYAIVNKRKSAYEWYEKLSPPRVITSDGEIISGQYKRGDIPAGAIVGLPVSSGVVEGRARVVLQLEHAALKDGDILVTAFTDPSWTPLFVSIGGLVTEVGGLMTHGAVIAREYGLPAIVGVENATRLIRDGQRIRVNGEAGYITILP